MGLKGWINQKRRVIMGALTNRIGRAHKVPNSESVKGLTIKNVLIVRPNHRLGNQLLTTPLVQEVENTFPNCTIDIFAKGGVAFAIFENYKSVGKIYQLPKKPFSNLLKYVLCWVSIKRKTYDIVINADKDSSSGRLLTSLAKAPLKVFTAANDDIKQSHGDYMHIAKYPIYNLRRYLAELNFPKNTTALPLLNLKLTQAEIANGKSLLHNIVGLNKPTICIYTNATGDKCYSEEWWLSFYAKLQDCFASNYNIIEMLPVEHISKINFTAPHFYSKDVREMASVIANTAIFISADNGVMHLASSANTPTVGLFSRNNQNIYMPYGNGSIALYTQIKTQDDIILDVAKILA